MGEKGTSGFSCCSTAEEVTQGINGFGLTAIVTGATSGIGMETTRVLTLHGVHFYGVNKKISKEYNSAGHPLNLLINNAGVMIPPFTLSQDKIELQFAVNHLGHFLLTNLLLENMKNTAETSKKKEGYYNKFHAYGQSKIANILHANELAKRLKEEGVNISANSVHPGPIATNIMRYNNILHGSINYMLCGFASTSERSGEYFSDNNIATNKTTSLANDSDLAKK
ncbi:hypothetical protein H5410_039926, partial [Solanum commersonii]